MAALTAAAAVCAIAIAVAACGLTGNGSEPAVALPPGEAVEWAIEYENPSPDSFSLLAFSDNGRLGGSLVHTCAASGWGFTETAPFKVYLVPGELEEAQRRFRTVEDIEAAGPPLVLDSRALSPPPGALGYRLVLDRNGTLAELLAIDDRRDPALEQLC